MNIAAAELNRTHIGLTIKVQQGDAEFRDILRGVSHHAEIVEERMFMQEVPDFMLGRSETTISLLHAGDVQVNGAAVIEFIGVEVS